MHNILHDRYYNLGWIDNYLAQTQSQTNSIGIILPDIHGVKTILNTNSLPEKKKTNPQIKKGSHIKPILGKVE